jgi:Fe-S oxidoreductase
MKNFLDWRRYEDAGMGDPYADIPKRGGDFAKAVAVCIGSRQCEQKGPGVMCPTYRITDNPSLSTGGRVRLLKKALNGELGKAGLLDPELMEAMDSCVSCKACKRECENAVDMAMIKVEYLAQLNAVTGLSLRARLFAGLPYWLHRQPRLSRLIRWRNRTPWLAKLGEYLSGISARQPLPEPTAQGFIPPTGRLEKDSDSSREVVLFVDTFSGNFEPDIANAAWEILTAAGYQVQLAKAQPDSAEPSRPLCCGRSFLSQGLVQEASKEASRTLAALLPHIKAGRPIIGLEPSCLLMFRDEYLALGLGEDADRLAKQTFLLEEFLARESSAKRLKLELQTPMNKAPALIHGHCHQKAVGAMKAMRKVLKLIPDLPFENIESSCCGMAGSFGMETEHFEMAQQMAQQALLPALQTQPDATVVANGFSCRQQIRNHSSRMPVHLAVLLRSALKQSDTNA